uniref:Tr-type G domain-containing protein n=1 Tax=Megaselia scalaris TaxID=36166 RepID=T1GZ94_MEGSC
HGVQAQTLANYNLAKARNLAVVPVINKIDIKHANPEAVCTDLHNLFGIDPDSVIKISAKLGIGIEEVLIAIIKNLPPPKANREAKEFRALLFDSWYDRYRGALNLVYVSDGKLEMGQEIQHHSTGKHIQLKVCLF